MFSVCFIGCEIGIVELGDIERNDSWNRYQKCVQQSFNKCSCATLNKLVTAASDGARAIVEKRNVSIGIMKCSLNFQSYLLYIALSIVNILLPNTSSSKMSRKLF